MKPNDALTNPLHSYHNFSLNASPINYFSESSTIKRYVLYPQIHQFKLLNLKLSKKSGEFNVMVSTTCFVLFPVWDLISNRNDKPELRPWPLRSSQRRPSVNSARCCSDYSLWAVQNRFGLESEGPDPCEEKQWSENRVALHERRIWATRGGEGVSRWGAVCCDGCGRIWMRWLWVGVQWRIHQWWWGWTHKEKYFSVEVSRRFVTTPFLICVTYGAEKWRKDKKEGGGEKIREGEEDDDDGGGVNSERKGNYKQLGL